jgi:fluoride exporter
MLLLSIAAGGALGTALRYALSGWVYARFGTDFPWGTLAVNMAGSLLLGLLLPLLDMQVPMPSLRAFLTVGCISAFTTFSTFAYETVRLIEDGERRRAVVYVAVSILLGLACIAAGLTLSLTLFT